MGFVPKQGRGSLGREWHMDGAPLWYTLQPLNAAHPGGWGNHSDRNTGRISTLDVPWKLSPAAHVSLEDSLWVEKEVWPAAGVAEKWCFQCGWMVLGRVSVQTRSQQRRGRWRWGSAGLRRAGGRRQEGSVGGLGPGRRAGLSWRQVAKVDGSFWVGGHVETWGNARLGRSWKLCPLPHTSPYTSLPSGCSWLYPLKINHYLSSFKSTLCEPAYLNFIPALSRSKLEYIANVEVEAMQLPK